MTQPAGHQAGPVLSVEDLRVHFDTEAGVVKAVDGVSWSVRPGKTLGIVGESGSGKSVSALAIMGLVPVPPGRYQSGRILFGGRDVLRATEKELRRVRGNQIAMIFQDPLSALNPVFKVGHQIAEVIRAHEPIGRIAARRRAVDLLAEVGLPHPRQQAEQYPHQFSGGMRQRAMIAMALALDPLVLLADEPTSGLDVTVQAQILELLRQLQRDRKTAIVLITHDLGVVAGQADRVVVMYAGKVAEVGDVDDIYNRPRHPYSLGLLTSAARLDRPRTARFRPIPGQTPSLIRVPPGCPFHPRCPFATDVCRHEMPRLEDQEHARHLAACHHSDRVAAASESVPTEGSRAAPATSQPAARPLVEVRELVKHYPIKAGIVFKRRIGDVRAVDGVSLTLQRGETFAVVGESGCGKSTLARSILRLVEPTSGSVAFDGEEISAAPARRLRRLRRDMQMIFQDPYASLNPRMTVRGTLAEPFTIHRLARDRKVAELLELVGLAPEHAGRYPHEFSGGQRQRVGIARAIALGPRLVVCDEPVSALDVSIRAQILNLLEDLQDRLGLTLLFIAHDLGVVRHIADRVAVMYLGSIVELAACDDLFERASHPYTQALISSVPVPDPGRERARPRILLSGDVPSPINPPSGCRFRTRCPKFATELSPSEQERCIGEEPALVDRGGGHPSACHYAGPRSLV